MKNQIFAFIILLINSTSIFGQFQLNATGTNDMRLRTNNADRLNILTNGNVGIGTATPLSKFHVSSGSSGIIPNNNAKALIEGSNNTYLNINTPDANEGGILFGRPTYGSASGGLIYTSDRSLQFRNSTNDTRMTITEPGFVGIGTSAPLSKLHIHDPTSFANFLKITNNATTQNQGLLIGVEGSGKSSIYELSGKGIGINVGGVSLDLKPSNTGGNAVEVSDKGVFSDLLPNVNIVPLAMGQLNFTVTRTEDEGYFVITNISHSYVGPIISSVNVKAYPIGVLTLAAGGEITINLSNAIQNNYTKLHFMKSIEGKMADDIGRIDTSINLGSNPKIYFNFNFNFILNNNIDFHVPFVLYGVK